MPESPLPLSPELEAFIELAPVVRRPHIPFLSEASASLPPASKVLDVGSGDSPYRELFSDHTYLTCDWDESEYRPDRRPDFTASAEDIPVPDESFDGIVCTQVLEHVPEPKDVVREFHRILRPGGRLWVTAPLTWYLHELPHDYYRYTSEGLRHVISSAGFSAIDVRPMNDSVSTLAQLVSHIGYLLGQHDDGHDNRRAMAGDLARRLSTVLEPMGELDTQWWLPVSFSAAATKPLRRAAAVPPSAPTPEPEATSGSRLRGRLSRRRSA